MKHENPVLNIYFKLNSTPTEWSQTSGVKRRTVCGWIYDGKFPTKHLVPALAGLREILRRRKAEDPHNPQWRYLTPDSITAEAISQSRLMAG